jgi:HlyD family secretion protein
LTIPIQAVTTREKDASKTKSKVVKNNDGEEELVKDLNEDDLKEVVFIIGKGDTIKMAEIKTGVQDDTYIEVLDGIKVGDEVVSGPYSTVARKLKAGNVVRKVKEDELFSDGKKKKTEDQ